MFNTVLDMIDPAIRIRRRLYRQAARGPPGGSGNDDEDLPPSGPHSRLTTSQYKTTLSRLDEVFCG
jgi:hypothetical protein